jgi:predicted CoA-binding protein
MRHTPTSVADFLQGRRIAVAGVSRRGDVAANAVFRKLRAGGYEVFPVNPNASEVEGVTCYPDVTAIPGTLDGVVIATHPDASAAVVRQCAGRGVTRVWFHRSFGEGSVSPEAVAECQRLGLDCIVGGCPLMFLEPVDLGHKCMRWWLQRQGRVPRQVTAEEATRSG